MKTVRRIPPYTLPFLMFWFTLGHNAAAGQDPFIGEINYVGFNFAPRDWVLCNGQILPINQYTSLFALIGDNYGGDGRTTFAVPDMRGRVPIHQGKGPGISGNYVIGMKGGSEYQQLTTLQLPMHTHNATATSMSTSTVAPGASITSTLHASSATANANPANNYLANPSGVTKIYSSTAPDVTLNPSSITSTIGNLQVNTDTNTTVTVQNAGTGQTFAIMQPYQVVNCIIATQGIFPQRQ